MQKILILVMSCEDEFFKNQEKTIKETWLKPVIDGKYDNINYCFYSGKEDIERHKYNKEEHHLTLRCEDNTENTFKKTYYAFKVCKKLLKNNGKVVMIHRPERLEEIMKSMTDNNITPKIIRFIYPKEGQNSNMIIIEGRKNARKGIKVLPPLIVHNKDNEYRDEIKKMFGGDRNESKEL